MALLGHILGVTFPFFALVLCGCVVTRVRLLPLEAIAGLNVFVIYLALPAMLFSFAAQTPIAKLMDAGTVVTYVLCAMLMLLLAMTTSGRRSLGWNEASFGALIAAFPNSGFLGVPLLVAMLGQQAAAPAIVALSVDMVLTTSVCIGLSRWGNGHGTGTSTAVLRALRGMLVNPLPWAILSGSLFSGLELELPAALEQVVRMLAQCASPVALIALGAALARPYTVDSKQRGAGTARPFLADGVGRLAAYKLLVHPLLIMLVAQAGVVLGLALDQNSRLVLILIAALPSASNVPILAERFGADASRLARVVMLGTVVSFASFSLLATRILPSAQLLQPPGLGLGSQR